MVPGHQRLPVDGGEHDVHVPARNHPGGWSLSRCRCFAAEHSECLWHHQRDGSLRGNPQARGLAPIVRCQGRHPADGPVFERAPLAGGGGWDGAFHRAGQSDLRGGRPARLGHQRCGGRLARARSRRVLPASCSGYPGARQELAMPEAGMAEPWISAAVPIRKACNYAPILLLIAGKTRRPARS